MTNPLAAQIRERAEEVEGRMLNIGILVGVIVDKLDAMECETPRNQSVSDAINLFVETIKQAAERARAENQQILELLSGAEH